MNQKVLAWVIAAVIMVAGGVLAYALFLPTNPGGVVPGSESVEHDYATAEELEAATNAGVDVVGKVARVEIREVRADGAFGHTLWAGEHLNFISDDDPGVGVGDTMVVRIDRVRKFLGSWLYAYTRLE